MILEHVGHHYTLVSYNGKTFFNTLSELPDSLIRLIKEKRPSIMNLVVMWVYLDIFLNYMVIKLVVLQSKKWFW